MVEFLDIAKFNREAVDWSRGARAQLLSAMKASGIQQYSGSLFRGLQARNRKRNNLIYRLSFPFPIQGIYTKLGVGNGTPITKAGTPQTKRKPKNWIDGTLDKKIVELANRIQPYYGDAVLNAFGEKFKK